jgi:hypothetical protein
VKRGDSGGEGADDGGDGLRLDSVSLCFVAAETGEEPAAVRVGGGVLDEFSALGGDSPSRSR